jgi:antitoxin VapB
MVYTKCRRFQLKTAKLFKNGRSQAVRLPKEFRFEGTHVFVKRVGSAVVLIPEHAPWQTLFESLEQFSDDFLEDRRQPEHQVREDPFE